MRSRIGRRTPPGRRHVARILTRKTAPTRETSGLRRLLTRKTMSQPSSTWHTWTLAVTVKTVISASRLAVRAPRASLTRASTRLLPARSTLVTVRRSCPSSARLLITSGTSRPVSLLPSTRVQVSSSHLKTSFFSQLSTTIPKVKCWHISRASATTRLAAE